jgi:predicted ATPase/class 3 adenylate cyclase
VAELPSGTVTFLFTDIEGSTWLWQEHPEPMRAALARHDEIVRDAITSHDGVIVKTTGDGAHAVFADASDAIDAAVAAQVVLAAESWSLPEPLRVRMGLHSGLAELRDGDYYGTAVNRAARIMSVAHGGQIVASLATSELVRDAPVELVDLGEHRLRDLGRAEHLFQVVADGLQRQFASLRSLDVLPGNLPSQQTSFVGRDDDVVSLVKLFDEANLVTLVGTGGVGKTRLAVQVAAEVLPRFADGAWFCDLSSSRDGGAMAQAVATALGCVQRAGMSLAASVVEYVKVRELLLVLDNCEQLLDEVSEFAEALLAACPRVKVLATSREAFGIPGERVLRVRSLDTPEPSATGEALLAWAAVRLFADRVADAGVGGSWSDAQWYAVGEICRRVDGIPLAVELAAARVASMRPTEIAAHLDERFRLLTGTRRGRVERHQTLRATVEWSYQLLQPDERAVFDRLGVFAGACDVAGAIAVLCGEELDEWAVTDALASLVAKSMVVVEDGPDDTTRYTMLETLRQYARERLDEAGDTDRCRRALAKHLADVALVTGQGAMGPEYVRWLACVRADIDNLRAVIAWALDATDPTDQRLGLAILASLGWIGDSCPELGLGVLGTQALPLAKRADPELRVPILTLAAYHHWYQGELDEARRLGELALEDGVVDTLLSPFEPYQVLVAVEMSVGNHARAFELIDTHRALLQDMDSAIAAHHLAGFADFEAMAGHLDAARTDSEHALQLAQHTGQEYALAHALYARAWALERDDPHEALASVEQFVDLYRRDGIFRGLAPGALSLAAGLRSRLGDHDVALPMLRDAVAIARDDGTSPQAAAALGFALRPLARTGHPDVAATLIGALDHGALARVANFPGSADARSRTLARIRDTLGVQRTDQLVEHGAAMDYDNLISYAIEHLTPPPP